MALNTYATLVSAATEYLARDNDATLIARIPDFITLAEAKFNRVLLHPKMEVRSTAMVDTGSTDPEFISLPSDFQRAFFGREPSSQSFPAHPGTVNTRKKRQIPELLRQEGLRMIRLAPDFMFGQRNRGENVGFLFSRKGTVTQLFGPFQVKIVDPVFQPSLLGLKQLYGRLLVLISLSRLRRPHKAPNR